MHVLYRSISPSKFELPFKIMLSLLWSKAIQFVKWVTFIIISTVEIYYFFKQIAWIHCHYYYISLLIYLFIVVVNILVLYWNYILTISYLNIVLFSIYIYYFRKLWKMKILLHVDVAITFLPIKLASSEVYFYGSSKMKDLFITIFIIFLSWQLYK